MTRESRQVRRTIGRLLSITVILYTLIVGLVVLATWNVNPRTDDAEVFANFIGIAPQVDGPITRLYVKDNQFVKKGDLLAAIDDRPYLYAVHRAKSEQAQLEGNIIDEQRAIAAQTSAVAVAQAAVRSAEANVAKSASGIEEAKAQVSDAEAGLAKAESDWSYATDNLHRVEPLLAEHFVTADRVDQARTLATSRRHAVEQERSHLKLAEASLQSAIAGYNQAQASLDQSHRQVQQATHSVRTLEPFVSARSDRRSAIDTAEYNLDNCRIYAPFDARVTNLTISEGEYAHTGEQMFTLIDTRTWWVIGNFRETQMKYIRPGMQADLYLLSDPTRRFSGTVESVGFGVTPDPDVMGKLSKGLPDVQRTLNWVHLASRFPVRVRIRSNEANLLRMGESAVVIVRRNSRLEEHFYPWPPSQRP